MQSDAANAAQTTAQSVSAPRADIAALDAKIARITDLVSCLVPEEGLEPSHLAIHDFESCASTIPPLRHVAQTS